MASRKCFNKICSIIAFYGFGGLIMGNWVFDYVLKMFNAFSRISLHCLPAQQTPVRADNGSRALVTPSPRAQDLSPYCTFTTRTRLHTLRLSTYCLSLVLFSILTSARAVQNFARLRAYFNLIL